MFKYFRHHFFNQLMLMNTLIVCAASLIFGFLALSSLKKVQITNQLRIYDNALIRLHETYLTKQEQYIDLMLTFYEELENYYSISLLLETDAGSLEDFSVFEIQSITKALKRLCNKDQDIVAIYIYKELGQRLFEYRLDSSILRELPRDFLLYERMKNKNFERSSYGSFNINVEHEQMESVFTYSIGGNLSTTSINLVDKPGNILIAYNAAELQRNLINRGLHRDSRFIICKDNGELIFDTERGNSDKSGFHYLEFDLSAFSEESSGNLYLNDQKYYYSQIRDTKRGYLSIYLAPREAILSGQKKIQIAVLAEAFVFVSMSALLFLVFTRWSTRRFDHLEQGITQIGGNNLSYRIPLPARQDEFAFITKRFNQMCDDLEESINVAYRYELQQKKAELYALQTSINPHFLYNTLEVIRNQLSSGHNADASEMILLLSKLYRSQMKGKMFISLREEIGNCTLYIDLYSQRHIGKLRLVSRIEPQYLRYGVAKHCIQPLIENFVVHGLNKEDNCIFLDAAVDNDVFNITVQDNGRQFSEEKIDELNSKLRGPESKTKGSGLRNVHERLKIIYGNNMGLELQASDSGRGLKVVMKIRPFSPNELEERYRKALGDREYEKNMHSRR